MALTKDYNLAIVSRVPYLVFRENKRKCSPFLSLRPIDSIVFFST